MSSIVNDPNTGEIINLSALRDMPIDEMGYTVPWAWRENDEHPEGGTLDLGYHYHEDQTRTATMLVMRSKKFYMIERDGNVLYHYLES